MAEALTGGDEEGAQPLLGRGAGGGQRERSENLGILRSSATGGVLLLRRGHIASLTLLLKTGLDGG